MGNGVKLIDSLAFENCTSIEKIELSESLSSISKNAFVGCSSLADVTVYKNISSISAGAFEGCVSLKNVYFKFLEEEMPRILVGDNPELDNIKLYFYSEEDLGASGNFGYYVTLKFSKNKKS